MTKTYKINGKEIPQAGAWGDDKNFGHNDVNDVVNQLLEALSDKEEDYSYLDNLEQISHCCKTKIFFKGAGNGLWCSNCKKEVFHTEYKEEPKQEDCKHDWIEYDREENNTPIDICRNCPATKKPKQEECYKGCLCDTKYICLLHAHGKQKQSTSLKEEAWNTMYKVKHLDMSFDDGVAEILNFFQSHLVKEIEKLEIRAYSTSVKNGVEVMDYEAIGKQDIIKIINNICN